jgi:hypothetical protein
MHTEFTSPGPRSEFVKCVKQEDVAMCAIGSVPRGPSRKMQKAIMRKPRFYFATAYIIAALLALASGAQAQAADRNIEKPPSPAAPGSGYQ